jgi:hypothetical protein
VSYAGFESLKVLGLKGQVTRQIGLARLGVSVTLLTNDSIVVGESDMVQLLDAGGEAIWSTSGIGRVGSVQQLRSGELLVADADNDKVHILEPKSGKKSGACRALKGHTVRPGCPKVCVTTSVGSRRRRSAGIPLDRAAGNIQHRAILAYTTQSARLLSLRMEYVGMSIASLLPRDPAGCGCLPR